MRAFCAALAGGSEAMVDSSDGSAVVPAPQAAPAWLERVHSPPYECVSLQHLSKARR